MPRSLLCILSCVAVACTASQASGDLLESVDLSGHGINSAIAYREIQGSEKFYFAPLRLGLAKTGGVPTIGVQYFKDDSTTPSSITASFTASVQLELPSADLNALKAALIPAGSPASIAALPLQYSLSFFRKAPAGAALGRVTVSEGNLAAGGTVAITFHVSATKQGIRALLSGKDPAFGLEMRLKSNASFGTARAVALSGDDLAAEMKSIGHVPDLADDPGANAVLRLLRSKVAPWGAGEEVAARSWLSALLGPPQLSLDETGKPRSGWDLSRSDLQDRLKGKTVVLRSLAGRSDKPHISLLFSFGDLCTALPNAIVDLDGGKSGCGGLN
jgi:hypothetical protein